MMFFGKKRPTAFSFPRPKFFQCDLEKTVKNTDKSFNTVNPPISAETFQFKVCLLSFHPKLSISDHATLSPSTPILLIVTLLI